MVPRLHYCPSLIIVFTDSKVVSQRFSKFPIGVSTSYKSLSQTSLPTIKSALLNCTEYLLRVAQFCSTSLFPASDPSPVCQPFIYWFLTLPLFTAMKVVKDLKGSSWGSWDGSVWRRGAPTAPDRKSWWDGGESQVTVIGWEVQTSNCEVQVGY